MKMRVSKAVATLLCGVSAVILPAAAFAQQ
jgi:hypothetical protein